eukprot:12476006-Alexandrium_andersonii.AAC.1
MRLRRAHPQSPPTQQTPSARAGRGARRAAFTWIARLAIGMFAREWKEAVSYTHLTLPTICSV